MPSLDEFAANVVRSGLVPAPVVEQARAALPPGPAADARPLAQALIARNALTPYQARKLLTGTTRGFFVGGHRILRPLGEGGAGKVFLASPRDGGPPVALKVLPRRKDEEPARAVEGFGREMGLSARVQHPNVAKTLEVGEDGGVHYMALEFVPGVTLYERVKASGPLPVPEAARFFRKVLDGLDAAHRAGLVHRDVKPSNLMVLPDGDAKVLDLGLALALGEEGLSAGTDAVTGTVDYASPEQLSDATLVDARSDLYSVGCALYFALAGRPPFEGGDAVNKIYKHRMEEPDPLETVAPGVPPAFAAFVRRLMAKNPELRPATARAARADLARWAPPAPSASRAAAAEPTAPVLRELWDDEPMPVVPEWTPTPKGKPDEESPWPLRIILIAAVLGSLAVLGIALMI